MCRNDNLTADYNNRSMYIWHNVDEILPFIIFSVKRKIPEFVNYIGRYSPPSIWNVGYILSEGCSVLTGKLWHFEDDFYTSYHYPTCMEA